MEGPEAFGNISKKPCGSLTIKFEKDCITEHVKTRDQYVADSSNIVIASNDRSETSQSIDNSATNNQTSTINNDTLSNCAENVFNNGLGNKTNKIKQIIEAAISPESKQTVSKILDKVNQLSIAEKLLLYLKLPTGKNQVTDPLRQPLNPLGSRFEIHQTITWIKTHLEEDPEVSLPKQDVYDEYIAYCESIGLKQLSTADFGKVMKQVFPRVRPRRLGTRGNSRYCYAGMRKRSHLAVPCLPDLGETYTNSGNMDETLAAASCLIREWAEKLLSVKFNNLQDLACHLVSNMCVDSRSGAAFTLLSSLEPQKYLEAKDMLPLLIPSGSQTSKHREAQIQLQRKLQEREIIREQKRKLQDQQVSSGRTSANEKQRTKRPKLSQPTQNVPTVEKRSPDKLTQENDSLVSFPTQKFDCDIGSLVTNGGTSDKHFKFDQYRNGGTSDSEAGRGLSGNKTFRDLEQPRAKSMPKIPLESVADSHHRTGADFHSFKDVPNKTATVKGSNRSGSNVKSRHLSLDFEPNLALTKQSGRNSVIGNLDYERKQKMEAPKPDKSKSSLRHYLESLPEKKSQKLPPIQDLNKELIPNVFKTSQSPISGILKNSSPPAKLPIPRLSNPNMKLPVPTTNLIILPPAVPLSPRQKYKPIQPKIESPPQPCMGKEGSAFLPPKPSPLEPPPVSVGSLEKDALDDYLHGGGNSQEQEEELLRYFQPNSPTILRNAPEPDKLSQLRLLLERDLVVKPGTRPLQPPKGPRRVSFETDSIPPSPDTRRRTFDFTPIASNPHSPLEASPFVSPRDTPVPRAKLANRAASFSQRAPTMVAVNTLRSSMRPNNNRSSFKDRNQTSANPENSETFLNSIDTTVKSRSNLKLQRSQSVTSNVALQNLLNSSNGADLFQPQLDNLDFKTFAKPVDFHPSRPSQVSVSAPHSPLVRFNMGASFFGSRPPPLQRIVSGDDVETSNTLSREVSLLLAGERVQKGVPNFAQLQYRSQSVPLVPFNEFLMDPGASGNLEKILKILAAEDENADRSQVPVHTESNLESIAQDYQEPMIEQSFLIPSTASNNVGMTTGYGAGISLNGETAFQITNESSEPFSQNGFENDMKQELDLQEFQAELTLNGDGGFQISGDGTEPLPPQNGFGEEIKQELDLQGFEAEFQMSKGDQTLIEQNVFDGQLRHLQGFDGGFQGGGFGSAGEGEGLQRGFPYTSTVEYVTDAALNAFPLNAMGLRVTEDPGYLRNELLLLRGEDNISQLEQEVDKL